MLIINPIPGQEEENAEFLEKNGVGIWLRKNDNPEEVVLHFFGSSENLDRMRQNINLIACKNSTESICKIIMKSL